MLTHLNKYQITIPRTQITTNTCLFTELNVYVRLCIAVFVYIFEDVCLWHVRSSGCVCACVLTCIFSVYMDYVVRLRACVLACVYLCVCMCMYFLYIMF